MAVRIEPNAEPIPGYRLIERLGVGGFGEVWKCEAPGGLYKAIKIVHGELGGTDALVDEDSRADQELKALKRVKTVHHPYILSLERYDIVEDQLMIVMELADRTLWDRFKECRSQGLPGIPRTELLSYMRETAEALDLMNDQFQLQHLDIKPQNLFLVFNHVKVADFGLVKDLGNKATATITGGVTPVYAAPETFDGWLSRFSDQYSLAIVFQELLTGQRPFGGATMRQLVLQHLQGSPDLAPLPAADRSVVARALSKDPEQRYPNCLEFVQELTAASPSAVADVPAGAAPATELPDSTEGPQTRDARGKSLGPWRTAEPEPGFNNGRPQVLPPRPDRPYTSVNADTPGPADDVALGHSIGRTTVPALRRGGAGGGEAPTFEPGLVQPALLIGLGGLGLRTLGQLRRRLTQELGRPEELPCIRLLGVDADPDAVQAASCGEPGQALSGSELLATRLHRASHYLKPNGGKAVTDSWLNAKLLYRIPRDPNSAGLRPLGRLAFVDHCRTLLRRLEGELQSCCEPPAAPPARPALAPRHLTPRVYIAACLAGNTGSGMFLDVAYAARDVLRRLGHGQAEVVGIFFLPAADAAARPALANAHAALTELSYFCRHPFRARYEAGDPQTKPIVLHDDSAPFNRCVLFTLPRPSGAVVDKDTARLLSSVGDYLYRDLATPLGPAADECRRRCLGDAGPAAQAGPALVFARLNRLSWPRQALLEHGARRVCQRLVNGWMSKDARPIAAELSGWADENWDALQLRPEALIAKLHERCEKQIKQPPDRLVTAITGPLGELLAPRPGKGEPAPALGPAVTALAELDALLGVPEECRASNQPSPAVGVLEVALDDAASRLADSCEQRLAEQVVKLIEDPRYRLAGAEEALRCLSTVAERALQAQETLARELNERAAHFYTRIQKLLETPGTPTPSTNATAWKLSFRRTPTKAGPAPTAELLELIRQYPKARYHALVLTHLNRLYVGLRGQLSDQLREVGFCRQRLTELSALVRPTADASADAAPLGRVLLPTGCQNLDDAVEQLDSSLTRDDLLALDQQVQALIRQQYRALVHVCMGSSAMVRALAPAMLARAREFLEPRFAGTSVADLLLGPRETDGPAHSDHAAAELQELYQRAVPRTGTTRPDVQFALAVLPGDERGQELQQLVRDDLSDVGLVSTDRLDEVLFYREHVYRGATGTELLGAAAQDAYRQRLAADPVALHTRDDIADWQPLAVAAR